MPKIYFYKLIADEGGAPCVQDGLLSLAICKPRVRSTANVGDTVMGFAGNSLNPRYPDNKLIYVAEVTKKLLASPLDESYYRSPEFQHRRDCIYEWRDNAFFIRSDARYHKDGEALTHDLGPAPDYERANVLLSSKFAYFGHHESPSYRDNYPLISEAIDQLGRGHRVNHPDGLFLSLEKLAKFSLDLNPPVRMEQSFNSRSCGTCGRDDTHDEVGSSDARMNSCG